ncbi:MAG TPA: GDP-mannose 4,6-dehydratase [Acidimicrobiales bacterium]|nr:GDP-mannose 4,6-dehydratase [Acidimicrobiales bacterium]
MRAFVTGGHGFVGTWLRRHLDAEGDDVVAPTGEEMDVTDEAAVAAAVTDAEPEVVYHLAGLAHVGRSWQEPAEFLRVNAGGTLNVLEAARRCATPPRVVVVSSAEVYGTVRPEQLPLTEQVPVRPVSPYAASKAAAEVLALQANLGHGTPVVVARPFNHIGPGQDPAFMVPGLATRILAARRNGTRTIGVGNLEPRRDLTDVRDIVRAYRLLATAGQPGATYNVCSGRDLAVGEVLDRLLALTGAEMTAEADPALVRAVEVPVLRGDPSMLRAATGWAPAIPLDDTLRAVLASLGG